jgi:proteasome lid subunit RPN8/RPN11
MALPDVFRRVGTTLGARVRRSSKWLRRALSSRQESQGRLEHENALETNTSTSRKPKFVVREDQSTREIVIRAKPFVAEKDTLFIRESAMAAIKAHIEWGRVTPENIKEQGGILIGSLCETPTQRDQFVIVTHALPIFSSTHSSGYIKFDHADWHKVLSRFDALKDRGRLDPATKIVGWYHTHPGCLDCFMSGTDLTTQRSVFHRPWNYALVLNPHRQIGTCFVGGEAAPCPVQLVD